MSDIFQQVFSLSLAANVINDYKGSLTSLQQAFQFASTEHVLPDVGDEWRLMEPGHVEEQAERGFDWSR